MPLGKADFLILLVPVSSHQGRSVYLWLVSFISSVFWSFQYINILSPLCVWYCEIVRNAYFCLKSFGRTLNLWDSWVTRHRKDLSPFRASFLPPCRASSMGWVLGDEYGSREKPTRKLEQVLVSVEQEVQSLLASDLTHLYTTESHAFIHVWDLISSMVFVHTWMLSVSISSQVESHMVSFRRLCLSLMLG